MTALAASVVRFCTSDVQKRTTPGRRPGRAVDGLAVSAGVLADRLLGEPPAGLHPVAAFGRAMGRLEGRMYADGRPAGVAFAAAGLGAAVLAARSAGSVTPTWPGRAAVLAGATYLVVAGRGLEEAAAAVAGPLAAGDLVAARRRLPALVGRDPDGLDHAEVARAVVESVAENTVDAVVAPALWGAAAGPAGALGYRALNTLDAMVGHRSPRYARFGWASARADDAANWIPARVTAALVAAVRPRRAREVWRCVRDQAGRHPSPNAGVAEAAFAAALGVRLGGRNVYAGRVELRPPLGVGRPPTAADIARAARLSRDVTAALVAVLLAGCVRWAAGA